jgi:predicted N-acyltransferase
MHTAKPENSHWVSGLECKYNNADFSSYTFQTLNATLQVLSLNRKKKEEEEEQEKGMRRGERRGDDLGATDVAGIAVTLWNTEKLDERRPDLGMQVFRRVGQGSPQVS